MSSKEQKKVGLEIVNIENLSLKRNLSITELQAKLKVVLFFQILLLLLFLKWCC